MLSINTNLSTLIAQRSMKQSTIKLNQAIERMTTGAKINHAKDNAANYNIATNMTTKLGALQVAEDNCAMGLDKLATVNGTLYQKSEKLQRLRNLAVQSSNGTYGAQSKQAINAEANALVDEIERLYNTAEYNGIKLFEPEQNAELPADAPRAQYNGFIKEVVKRDTSTMKTLASVDVTQDLVDGTYSISTPEEMKKLADMTNAGLVSAGDEFVLANDIDLGCYENWTPIGLPYYDGTTYKGTPFMGKFDGNGYFVSNLRIKESPEPLCVGLFAMAGSAWHGVHSEIKNLGIKNVDIDLKDYQQVGSLIGYAAICDITNCYVERGRVLTNGYGVGGLVGNLQSTSSIDSCYTNLEVVGRSCVGGIVGALVSTVKNSYSLSDVTASQRESAGGIAGLYYFTGSNIINCYVDARNVEGGVFLGQEAGTTAVLNISNSSYLTLGQDKPLVYGASTNLTTSDITNYLVEQKSLNLQVGVNSKDSSHIDLYSSLDFFGVNYLRNIGVDMGSDFLSQIDTILHTVTAKQTENGAIENRLNSALEEISTQYENLVSSRSTLQDADIAEVSSEYIRQQILQQASATLLATANQSASIALSLI